MPRSLPRICATVTMLLACALALPGAEPAAGQIWGDFETRARLETDRDSFTPAPNIVGHRLTMLEASFSYVDNKRPRKDTFSYPEFLIRHGIFRNLEWRLGWNFEAGGPSNPVSGFEFGEEDFVDERASRLLYGLKWQLTGQADWLPEVSLLIESLAPTSGPNQFTTFNVGPVFGWQFANGSRWDSAIRYSTSSFEHEHFDQWAPSSVIRFPVGDHWTGHVEYFGIMSAGKEREFTTHYFGFGPHFLPTQNFEIGGRVGFGINEQSAPFFANIGVGWRF